jgi:hypothetical protein
MDQHVRTLGNLNIAYGIFSLLASLCVFIGIGGFDEIYRYFNDPAAAVVATFLAIYHALIAIPCIVGGIFLKRLRVWSRSFVILVSALNALNIPVGTLLGVYGLWVLLTPETEPLFALRRSIPAHKTPAAEAKQGDARTSPLLSKTRPSEN